MSCGFRISIAPRAAWRSWRRSRGVWLTKDAARVVITHVQGARSGSFELGDFLDCLDAALDSTRS